MPNAAVEQQPNASGRPTEKSRYGFISMLVIMSRYSISVLGMWWAAYTLHGLCDLQPFSFHGSYTYSGHTPTML